MKRALVIALVLVPGAVFIGASADPARTQPIIVTPDSTPPATQQSKRADFAGEAASGDARRVIGADGGLLERPIGAREIFLSPSERAGVMLDLSAKQVGERIVLSSLPFDAMHFSSNAAGAVQSHDAVPANGAPLEIMLIRVAERVSFNRAIPQKLSRIEPMNTTSAAHRVFTLDQSKGMWRINRASYRMTDTAFSVTRGATEIWEFRNLSPTDAASDPHSRGSVSSTGTGQQPRAHPAARAGCPRNLGCGIGLEGQRTVMARRNPEAGDRFLGTPSPATRSSCSSAITSSTRAAA